MKAYYNEYDPKDDQEQGVKTRYKKIMRKTGTEEEDAGNRERWWQVVDKAKYSLGNAVGLIRLLI